MNNEKVNHPQHYGGDTPYEAIKVIEAWNVGFHVGNAIKYLSRAGKKPGESEINDLRKAAWYIDRRLKLLGACEAAKQREEIVETLGTFNSKPIIPIEQIEDDPQKAVHRWDADKKRTFCGLEDSEIKGWTFKLESVTCRVCGGHPAK